MRPAPTHPSRLPLSLLIPSLPLQSFAAGYRLRERRSSGRGRRAVALQTFARSLRSQHGTADLWTDERRLGGALPRRPAARGAAREDLRAALGVRAGRAAVL